MFGNIGGPLVAGAFADFTGNYELGFTILASLAGLGSLFFWVAKAPSFGSSVAHETIPDEQIGRA